MAKALHPDRVAVSAPGRGSPAVRFERCDPEEPPAAELLAAMRAELNDVYETFSRLDNPPLAARGAAPAGWRILRRLRGTEPVAGGGVRRLGDGVAEIKRMYVRPHARSRGVASVAPRTRSRMRRARWATRRSASTPVPSRSTRSGSTGAAGYVEVLAVQRQPVRLLLGREDADLSVHVGLGSDGDNGAMTERIGGGGGPTPVDGGAGPGGGDSATFRARWAWTLHLDRSMSSPFIGFLCAVSIGVPLAIGIAADYPRVGGWGAVGAFFTDMAVFQPGHRFRARIVAGAAALVAVAAFLGALCGIRSLAIFPVGGHLDVRRRAAGRVGPAGGADRCVVGDVLVFSASFDVSPTQALIVGAVTLASGLFTALLALLGPAPAGPLRRPVAPLRHRRRAWLRQAAATLGQATRLRSVGFWHALRLSAAALVGTVLYRITNPADGFWIPEAALFIMRPDATLTKRRAVLRVIGSVAGAALTTLLLLAFRPGPTLLAVFAVVASGIAFSVQRVNFGLYITFVTCIFVLLTAFGGLPARTALANRVVDNLIGSAIAVAALWLWPHRPKRAAPAEP